MYSPKFNYPETRHKYSSHGRFYEIDGQRPLPSVTTILSNTVDHSWLDEWRAAVGEEEAERIVAESLSIGNGMHDLLEQYYIPEKDVGKVSFTSKRFADIIKKKALSRVSEVWGVESALYYPDVYAGSTDLVGVFENKPTIMDYKNSRRDKGTEDIEEYFMQAVAYAFAHNDVHGTKIKRGAIFMMCRSGRYKEFILEGNEFKRYEDKWFKLVEKYYKEFGVEAP